MLVVSTTLLTSSWASILIFLCDSVLSSSFVGDAERFLLLAVDVAVASTAFSLSLVLCVPEASNGLNCTITAVILSQPVPSPIVFGAKQAVNSCKLENRKW